MAGHHPGDADCQLIVGVEVANVPADLRDDAPSVLAVARLRADRVVVARAADFVNEGCGITPALTDIGSVIE